MAEDDRKTHFGYQTVAVDEKSEKVADVFHSVAGKYDLMNDLMSAGVHRLWKRFTIDMAAIRPGQRILDLASGTGDLALQFADLVEQQGQVIFSDINDSMLSIARERCIDEGKIQNTFFVQADAQSLPFPDNYFDCITIAFGLRNVTHKDRALSSMLRVLKPGGKCLILEFSKPTSSVLSALYDTYSFSVLPKLGGLIAGDQDSYQYLAESIRMHPKQEELLAMMQEAGFEGCDYHNLTGGVVALHRGYKY